MSNYNENPKLVNKKIDREILKLKVRIADLQDSKFLEHGPDRLVPMLISYLKIWVTRCLVKIGFISPQYLFSLMIDNQYVKNNWVDESTYPLPTYFGPVVAKYELCPPILSERALRLLEPCSKRLIS